MEEMKELLIAHSSFLVISEYHEHLLYVVADDLEVALNEEAKAAEHTARVSQQPEDSLRTTMQQGRRVTGADRSIKKCTRR